MHACKEEGGGDRSLRPAPPNKQRNEIKRLMNKIFDDWQKDKTLMCDVTGM